MNLFGALVTLLSFKAQGCDGARFEAANPFGVSVDGVLRWLGRRGSGVAT